MAISYNRMWKLLVDKKMSKADLRKAADIAVQLPKTGDGLSVGPKKCHRCLSVRLQNGQDGDIPYNKRRVGARSSRLICHANAVPWKLHLNVVSSLLLGALPLLL